MDDRTACMRDIVQLNEVEIHRICLQKLGEFKVHGMIV